MNNTRAWLLSFAVAASLIAAVALMGASIALAIVGYSIAGIVCALAGLALVIGIITLGGINA